MPIEVIGCRRCLPPLVAVGTTRGVLANFSKTNVERSGDQNPEQASARLRTKNNPIRAGQLDARCASVNKARADQPHQAECNVESAEEEAMAECQLDNSEGQENQPEKRKHNNQNFSSRLIHRHAPSCGAAVSCSLRTRMRRSCRRPCDAEKMVMAAKKTTSAQILQPPRPEATTTIPRTRSAG